MSGAPRISVIVPVRNRKALLTRLLDGLEAQTWRDFELVIVDDGSDDGAGDVASRRGARVVSSGGVGAVAARRIGVSVATGDVLVFTDSDCRPRPGWLAALATAFDGGADVVHGPTIPERPPGPMERSVDSAEEGLYPTCNIAYRKAVYERLGGFDGRAAETLGFRHDARARGLGFGEDTLLGWRARRAGADVRFAPDAIVEHHVFPPDLVEALSRAWMAGAFPALVREVPELRATLVRRGVLFGSRTRVPAYVTGAALASRRRWAIGASVAWWAGARYAGLRRSAGSRRRRLAAVPEEMVIDAVVAAALVTGSVRARTLLL